MFKSLKEKMLLATTMLMTTATLAASETTTGIGGVVKGVGGWTDSLKSIIPNLLILGGWVCIGLGAWQFAKAAKPNSQGGSYVYAFMLLIGGIIMVGHEAFVGGSAKDMGFSATDWQSQSTSK